MGSVVLNGTTSGSTTLTPTDAVTATLTLPNATSTLLASATAIATPISGTPTSSNFLRGDGTWNAPASGAMTLITTTTASASSSVDFTGLSSTYKNYVVMITNCVLNTTSEYLAIRTSTNNGSTFDSAAASYAFRTIYSQQGTVSSVGGESATYINPCASFYTSNTANNGGINGTITLVNPSNASATNMYGTLSSWEGTTLGVITFAGTRIATAGVVNAIRFYPLSGTITSGTFKLYGIS